MILFASPIVCMILSFPIISIIVFSASSLSLMIVLTSHRPRRKVCSPRLPGCSFISSRIRSRRIATYIGQYSRTCVTSSTSTPHCLQILSFLSSLRLLPDARSRTISLRPVSILKSFVPLLRRNSVSLPITFGLDKYASRSKEVFHCRYRSSFGLFVIASSHSRCSYVRVAFLATLSSLYDVVGTR